MCKAIVDNLYQNTSDYAREDFVFPEFCKELVNNGALGRKTGEGLYKVVLNDDGSKIHQVYDIEHGSYRNVMKYTFSFVETMLAYIKVGNYKAAFKELVQNRSTEAEICCSFLICYIIYSLAVSGEVADNIHAADVAMATGFNWCPPMALVDAFGGKECFVELCKERLSEEELQKVEFDQIIENNYDPTEYDYRKFFRAMR